MGHKWQQVTLGQNKSPENHQPEDNRRSPGPGGISPSVSRRLRFPNVYSDSDDESCQSPEHPFDVPKGYLAVYVGPELRRFIIPTSYLSDPLFKVLLEKVEEEFGFDHSGGLTIPCEIETFKYLLKCMESQSCNNKTCPDDTISSAGSSFIDE